MRQLLGADDRLKFTTAIQIPLLLVFAAALPIQAQLPASRGARKPAMPALIDAPRPSFEISSASPLSSRPAQPDEHDLLRQAPRLARYIQPDEWTIVLSTKDKLKLAIHEQARPYAFTTQILAAGWEQLLNSNPKYGTDSAGFGERLGAAAIRQNSSALLSDGVLAAMFHQDPRYYRKGTGKIVDRILYAASRIVITRTDAGTPAPNYSRLLGGAGAYALTLTYYPAVSATWPETAEGYFISLPLAALGNTIHEFLPDLRNRFSHNRSLSRASFARGNHFPKD